MDHFRVRVGTPVTYTCANGFYLSGSTDFTCQDDGAWGDEPPVCRECNGTEKFIFQVLNSKILVEFIIFNIS